MTFHIGLIGGGGISETHARAAREIPGVKIAAVFGTNHKRVTALAREQGAAAYSDFAAFLAHQPMQMVIVGSPSGLHAEQGIAAAHRGLHVLTEKPIDISTERADALVNACREACVQLGVCFQDRLRPGIRRMKQLLDEGRIGRPLLAEARVKWFRPPEYYAKSRWRGTLALDGGGALMNQGIHTLDLLLWLLGDVRSVQGQKGALLHQIEAEDTVVATLEFSSGALGVLHATTAAYPGYPRRLEVSGTEGTLILEGENLVGVDLRSGPGPEPTPPSAAANTSTAVVSDASAHRAVLEDFLRAIQIGGTPACDGGEGRRSVALAQAIYRACETGQRTAVR